MRQGIVWIEPRVFDDVGDNAEVGLIVTLYGRRPGEDRHAVPPIDVQPIADMSDNLTRVGGMGLDVHP